MAHITKTVSGINTGQTRSKWTVLKDDILDGIRSGRYGGHGDLPSIRDFAKNYRVSKATVTQALFALREMGVIDIVHGKTTTVRQESFKYHIELFYSGGKFGISTQPFWRAVYEGIATETDNFPGCVCTCTQSLDEAIQAQNLNRIHGALMTGTGNPELFRPFLENRIPCLAIYQYPVIDGVSYVTAAVDAAIRDVIARFACRGCRNALFLFPFQRQNDLDRKHPPLTSINRRKFELIRDEMLAAGVMADVRDVIETDSTIVDGYNVICQYVRERGRRPDGIMLGSDAIALGVYRALGELGLKIPDDVAVAGFDNLTEGAYLTPSLTTIDVHRQELGRLAFQKMAKFLTEGTPLTNEFIPAEVVIRESLT